jgi:glutamate-1-semialdehyde 2,1-aminomutase
MARARKVMPGGSSRSHAFFRPYPLVFERGEGPYLWDVDGNRYVDLTYNGLSLIHGHAYRPVEKAVAEAMPTGTAWVGSSAPQIAFAEDLCDRIPCADLVRFTNTGTEATMLAVKLARQATGRPLVLKSWGAYHGSYDDLEAGLYGNKGFPGRTALARFGDLDSYREAFAQHGDQIAALIIEPVLLTFRVVSPSEGFLPAICEMAKENGSVVILDDCLMFRLAFGGSAEKYGIEPDLTCLGKFIGGGLPMGVVGGRREVMGILDPYGDRRLYHGGSFNGNPLAATAGRISLRDLTADKIAGMDQRADRIRSTLRAEADRLSLRLDVSGDGSVIGNHLLTEDGETDREAGYYLHLAAVDRGVFFGPDGEMAMCTTLDDEALEIVIEGMSGALEETASWIANGRPEGSGHGR